MVMLAAFTSAAGTRDGDGGDGVPRWSVGAGAGVYTPLKGTGLWKGMRPAMTLSLDRKISPAFTLGAEGLWGFNTSRLPGKLHSKTAFDDMYVGPFASLDIRRLMSPEGPAPRWDFGVKAGAGWGHMFRSGGVKDHNYFATTAGLFVKYRLSPGLALSLTPAFGWNMSDAHTSNSSASYNAWYGGFSLLAGLKYSFGPTFSALPEPKNDNIDALNGQINSLRADLATERRKTAAAKARAEALAKELVEANAQSKVVKEAAVDNHLNTELVVFFMKGSSYITPDQMPNVDRIASYLKSHPAATVDIKGYASSDGNDAFNRSLASRRAEAVRDALVGRFGVRPARITASGEGVAHLFDEESWNRVCVCTIKN